jgi:hypothetical protein
MEKKTVFSRRSTSLTPWEGGGGRYVLREDEVIMLAGYFHSAHYTRLHSSSPALIEITVFQEAHI